MSSPPPKQSKGAQLKEKVKAKYHKLRKTPVVTPEQKLHTKLDSMKTEATDLNDTVSHLLTQAAIFTSRAQTTPEPSAPPVERAPLFERHETGPASNYDAQVKAYNDLTEEWDSYKKDVEAFEEKFDGFQKTLRNLKEKHYDTGKPVGKTEHEFIGLDNAEHNLKLKKRELESAVEGVGLPKGE